MTGSELLSLVKELEVNAEANGFYEAWALCPECGVLHRHAFQNEEEVNTLARLACFDRARVSFDGAKQCPRCDIDRKYKVYQDNLPPDAPERIVEGVLDDLHGQAVLPWAVQQEGQVPVQLPTEGEMKQISDYLETGALKAWEDA